jgi:hypothetical protein
MRKPRFQHADEAGAGGEKLRLAVEALQESRLAASAWLGCLRQDGAGPDADKDRYFYADALHTAVRLQLALHKFDPARYAEPTPDDVAAALAAAVASRDSSGAPRLHDNASLFVQDLSRMQRDHGLKANGH